MSNSQAFYSWKAGAKVGDIAIQSKYIYQKNKRKRKKNTKELINNPI